MSSEETSTSIKQEEKSPVNDSYTLHNDSQQTRTEPTPTTEFKRVKTENAKIEEAEDRIEKDTYDTEAWTILMAEVDNMRIEEARPYYERFFKYYPTAGRYWKYYAEHEIKSGEYKRAENIFRRCLTSCLNVELWKSYLSYIESKKGINPQTVNENVNQADLEEVIRSYKYACDHVGKDVNATDIWRNLIKYIKLQKAQYNVQFEQQTKLRTIREIYQRAIQIPMHDLDNLWKEYEQFENEYAKPMAKQVLAENMPRFKAAWQKYKEKKNIREGLLLNMLAKPPSGSPKEEQQKKIWKHLISFEKRNTQRLPMEEVRQRVVFTYEQALLCLYHYAEIWYEAAMYLASYGAHEDASKMFERAVKALPKNILIHFAFADYEETKKNFDKAAAIYEDLLSERQDAIIYIQYQKFVRRKYGVDRARQVFVKAAKSENCSYHVYVASALMEFQINKNAQVAVKVFERGLKNPKFMQEPAYILEYLKLLEHLNDRNNTRVLFKKVLSTIPKEKSLEIWNKFLEFEYSEGDPNAINEVEESKAAAFGDISKSEEKKYVDIVNRFKFMDLWPCNPKELEFMDNDNDLEVEKNFGGIFQFYNQPTTTQQSKAIQKRSSKYEKEHAKAIINKFKDQYYKPDTSKMLKITPSEAQLNRPVPTDGSLPDAVANIYTMIPTYNGPLPDIAYVMNTLRTNTLPSPPVANEPLFEQKGMKRARSPDEEEEDSITMGALGAQKAMAPQTDLYQMRRKKMQRTDRKSVV